MICPKCNTSVPDSGPLVLKHFREYHGDEKDLGISCPACVAIFQTVSTFHKHWYKEHHSKQSDSKSEVPSKKMKLCEVGSSSESESVDFTSGVSSALVVRSLDSQSGSPSESESVDFTSGVSSALVVRSLDSQSGSPSDSEPSCVHVLQSVDVGFIENVEDCIAIESLDSQAIPSVDSTEVTSASVSGVNVPASVQDSAELSESDIDSDCTDDESSDEDGFDVSDVVSSVKEPYAGPAVNKKAASFLLHLKDTCNLPSSSVKKVITNTEELLQSTLSDFSSCVNDKLGPHNISLNDVMNVNETVQSTSRVFDNIRTETQQTNYFNNTLGVVEPLHYPIGLEFKQVSKKGVQGRASKLKEEEILYVPITEVVEKLVNHPDYHRFVEEGALKHNSPFLDSYMKGSAHKSNKVLCEHPDAIRFVLYYDDLEVCSPLKSRKGNQKLAAFYMFLDNIPHKYRSNLNCIFLVALVNVNLLKTGAHGFDAALEYIVNDLKKFEQGFTLKTGKKVYGTLIATIGDNLGSNGIGGFKEGFTANRCCRVCLATLNQIRSMKKEDPGLWRTAELHNEHCSKVQTSRGKNETLSTEYGVNRDSALNKLSSYHVVWGLPPDVMHDLLEGCIPLTIKKLLRHYLYDCKEKLFTLKWLNARIQGFDYGDAEMASKPSLIKEEHLSTDDNSTKLNQSASQMWLLATILPLIIGPLIKDGDKYYENYLTLLEVCRIAFSEEIESWMVLALSDAIERYLTDYKSLYGDLIFKQHNLTHYPTWVLRIGSLVNYNCMRCEGKHRYFKRLVNVLYCYKNIPLSLTEKHQLNQAACWSNSLVKAPSCGPYSVISPKDFAYKSLLDPSVDKIIETSWVKHHGIKFTPEKSYICIGHDDNSLPIFAKVVKVLLYPSIQFICKKVTTVACNYHLAAYHITVLDDVSVYSVKSMLIHSVFNAHKVSDKLYIALKFSAGGVIF